MTTTPSPVSLGKVRLTVDTLDSIRSNIAAYAGGPAIARELIQNADDARATDIQFWFYDDRLIVKNNSVFSTKDFEAILRIGSGSKRADQASTGTWGTGFLSVYQITDRPIIRSAGRQIRIDPTGAEADFFQSDVQDSTEFHFLWRKTASFISEQIEADLWSPERIKRFEEDLVPEIYRALPFLRNIERITVNSGKGLLCQVSRRRVSEEVLYDGSRFERWDFAVKKPGQPNKTDTWLFYRHKLDKPGFEYRGGIIKGPEYAVGIGPATTGVGTELRGTLYNFLPTEIETGFAFHIQGDFFPDANRKSILKSDGSDKSRWNEELIEGLARLFARHLLHLRDQVVTIKRTENGDFRQRGLAEFYRLLPIRHDPRHPFLTPIVEAFRRAIPSMPLVITTDKKWTPPVELRMVGQPFRALVEDYMNGIVPGGFPADLFEFLKSVGSRELTGRDFLNFLRNNVPDGVAVEAAPPVVNSREKLEAIFRFFTTKLNQEMRERLLPDLTGVPLCLDTTGRLWAFDHHPIYLADKDTRQLLPEGAAWLVDADFQAKFEGLLKEKLPAFGVAEMVGYLKSLAPDSANRLLKQAGPALDSYEKIGQFCTYLLQRGVFEKFQPAELGDLTLAIDRNQRLQPIAASQLWLGDKEVRQLLGPASQFEFAFEGNNDWREFLQRAGMKYLDTSRLLAELEKWYKGQAQLPAPFGQPGFLVSLYRYFSRHFNALTEQQRQRLARLPFVLTQKGQLAPASNLSLPPATGNNDLQALSKLLQLDHLVSEQILEGDLRNFFARQLEVKTEDTVDYIGKYIQPNYNGKDLTHAQRHELLHFIQRSWPQLTASATGLAVLNLLTQTALIHCDDGQYRPARQVYWPGEHLDKLFPNGYPVPHAAYNSPGASAPGQFEAQTSPFTYLFEKLGLQAGPVATDLVEAVRQTISQGRPVPQSPAYEHIRQVYEFLDANWDGYYAIQAANLEPLQTLEWLPGEGEGGRWYTPAALYPISLRDLVGSQVKLLPLRQARRNFSEWLGLNIAPKLEDVIEHLLQLSRTGQPLNTQRVYTYLYEQRQRPELDRLKNEAVIYDEQRNRYWKPEQVFLDNFYEDFGRYRLYLENASDWASLFTRLGVRAKPDPIKDYVNLLRELTRSTTTTPLAAEDKRLLLRAYEKLAEQLPADPTHVSPDWLKALQAEKLVLTKKGELCRPDEVLFDDSPVLREKFEAQTLNLADFTHNGERFLVRLGIRSLSEVVTRELIDVKEGGLYLDVKTRLRLLRPQFERIKEHFVQKYGNAQKWSGLDWLNQVEVVQAEKIIFQYKIKALPQPLAGHYTEAEAFYNGAEGKLYLKKNIGSQDWTALARELAIMLNPSFDTSTLMFVLDKLLSSNKTGEAADRILDRYEIRGLAYSQLPQVAIDEAARQQSVLKLEVRSGETEKGSPEPAQPTRLATPSQPGPLSPERMLPFLDMTTPFEGKEAGPVIPPTQPQPAAPTIPAEESKTLVPEPTLNQIDGPALEKPAPEPVPTKPQIKLDPAATETKPAPAQPLAIPAFQGETRPNVPQISTNWEGLKRRYPGAADATPTDSLLPDIQDQPEEEISAQSGPVDNVKITLSYMMRYGGFFNLTNRLKKLLEGQPPVIQCRTEFDNVFPLYLDRQREIIYNQKDLPAFFAAHNIPAGGNVYMGREYGNQFRLYYKKNPHIVKDVRLAFFVDGKVQYETIEAMEIECETEDMVFVADKRLEDSDALFAEAYTQGKKSVFETIIDVFEANQAQKLTEKEINQQVHLIRMVAAQTVRLELEQRACFIEEAGGYWRFEPDLVQQSRYKTGPKPAARPVTTPNQNLAVPVSPQPTSVEVVTPVATGQAELEPATAGQIEPAQVQILTPAEHLTVVLQHFEAETEPAQELVEFRPVFNNFVVEMERLYKRQNQPAAESSPFGSTTENVDAILAELRHDPNDWARQEDFKAILSDLLQQFTQQPGEPADDLKLVLGKTPPTLWEQLVRPLLETQTEKLSHAEKYRDAIALLNLDQPQFQAEKIARLKACQEAYEYYEMSLDTQNSLEERVDWLREAVRLNPNFTQARKRLEGQLQVYAGTEIDRLQKQLKTGVVIEAMAGFSGLLPRLIEYKGYLYNPVVLSDMEKPATRLWKEIVRLVNERPNESAQLQLAQTYLGGREMLQVSTRPDYAKTLVWLAGNYLKQAQFVEAALVAEQAYRFIQDLPPTLHGELFRCLEQTYAGLNIWSYSLKWRKELTKLAPTSQKAAALAEEDKARAELRALDEPSKASCREKYLAQLQKYQREQLMPVPIILTRGLLQDLIEKEQKELANRG